MVRKWSARLGLILCLLIASVCPAQGEDAPGEIALRFQAALKANDRALAAALCLDGEALASWAPPEHMRFAVYPSIEDAALASVERSDACAVVTLSLTALDLTQEEAFVNKTEGLENLYQPDSAEEIALRLNAMQQELEHTRRAFSIPYVLRPVGDTWKVDLAATLSRWPYEPAPAVSVASYGILEYDSALLSYFIDEALLAGSLECPEDADWVQWRASLTADEVFGALGEPVYNVWLRLTADTPAEELTDFCLAGGACRTAPERYFDYVDPPDILARHWVGVGGRENAVLLAALPLEGKGDLCGYTLSCRRRLNSGLPFYREETLVLPLEGVPYAEAVPAGSVRFTLDRFFRLQEGLYTQRWGQTVPVETLGQLMVDEFDGGGEPVWLRLPEDIAGLPVTNDRYALYRLQGTLAKASGYFGVYDVTFTTQTEGAFVKAFERCGTCDAIDVFDLPGMHSGRQELLQIPVDLTVLLPIEGRTEDELEDALRNLDITASFSGEKIDYCYEQHGTTTRIGPRSSIAADLSSLSRWDGDYTGLLQTRAADRVPPLDAVQNPI